LGPSQEVETRIENGPAHFTKKDKYRWRWQKVIAMVLGLGGDLMSFIEKNALLNYSNNVLIKKLGILSYLRVLVHNF